MFLWEVIFGVVFSEEVCNVGVLEGVGFLVVEISELCFVVFWIVYFDNVFVYFLNYVWYVVSYLWGVEVGFGRFGML